MKREKGQRTPAPGSSRPPEYVIILWASDWAKEHDPRNRYNLWDALHAGKDPDPEPEQEPGPEPDLEAEP